jgi:molybdopterin/thiamine biosynthesis adenylyltransferase
MLELTDPQLARYARHILMDEIDIAGQAQLFNSHALIIGCGGLGSACVPYLVASGVGRLTIIDPDVIELSNLQRQVTYRTADIGASKAHTLRTHLNALNPEIEITALQLRLNETQLYALASDAVVDIIIDCTDNFKTRHVINRVAHALKIPLISGSAVRTEGQLSVYDARVADAPCYACAFPETHDSNDGACATLGIFSPVVGIIGAYQANLALQVLLNWTSVPVGELLHFDARAHRWSAFRLNQNPKCAVCT